MTVNGTLYTIPEKLVTDISFLVKVLEALGGIIVLYIIFNIFNILINRKKKKELEQINETLNEIKNILKRKK